MESKLVAFLFLAGVALFGNSVQGAQVLTSPLVTNWGTWGEFVKCPAGTKVISVQIKSQPWDFWDIVTDDTTMNGIKFVCGNERTGDIATMIQSKEGNWGNWGKMFRCDGNGYMRGFTIRSVEATTANVDESATNNMRIHCAGSTIAIQMDGEQWGEWTNPRICDSTEYVCGIQTQVEDPRGAAADDTSLNNVRVECCDLSAEDLKFYGIPPRNSTL